VKDKLVCYRHDSDGSRTTLPVLEYDIEATDYLLGFENMRHVLEELKYFAVNETEFPGWQVRSILDRYIIEHLID
jgi:hypothetical protein